MTASSIKEAFTQVLASLAAAISILERTPQAKKAVASDTMFDISLNDYRKALETGRAALATLQPSGERREAIARIINPVAYQNYDDACRRNDGLDQMVWIGGVNKARVKVGQILASGLVQDEARALNEAEIRAGINILLETIANKFDEWKTNDVFKSQASDLVRNYKHR